MKWIICNSTAKPKWYFGIRIFSDKIYGKYFFSHKSKLHTKQTFNSLVVNCMPVVFIAWRSVKIYNNQHVSFQGSEYT